MENVKISYIKNENNEIISPVVSDSSVFNSSGISYNNLSFGSIPIGSGMDYYGTEAPINYMFANGDEISRTEYAELFAIIGVIYGEGDGENTFNLPDKRERVTIQASDNYTIGSIGGESEHTLTVSEMPKHTHNMRRNYTAATGGTAVKYIVSGDGTINAAAYGATESTGSGNAHNNLQPYLVCNYIIKVK